ncbi:MAG: hypothetical protein ABI852_18120, partial [Gemmatimonadaceae bacterium]
MTEAQTAPFVLPKPTGRFGIGTASWYVTDATRTESFSSTAAQRQIKVTAWYPTELATAGRAGIRAPYLRETLREARAFATQMGDATAYDNLAAVQTHSFVDAPILAAPSTFPVLLFSHGFTGLISAHTALIEDLASRGYVVLSVAHTYEVVATTLSNGAFVTMLDAQGELRQPIRDVITEWSDVDSMMARVTAASSDAEKLNILNEYLSRIPKTHAVVDRWTNDAKLVLDKLPTLSPHTIGGQLARRIDLGRLGVLGHSMGGVMAGQFCIEDSRCRAGLNLDGVPQTGTMINAKMKQPFLMMYSARPGRLGASDLIYSRATSRYYRADVDDTLHNDFTDMNFWGGPLRKAGAFGSMAPERSAELTRLIVGQFFDQELRGIQSMFLN